ncbi:hypothetical protein [Sulfuricaulis sp.]|jgi:hypothetical protein|uniref:hypothetical protein n=1 Tax=Sulfuricaulis sp. TaxID=2003553 RepID=UPI003559F3C8
MPRVKVVIFLILLFSVVLSAVAAGPERSKGISLHMLPKQVAEIGDQKWGFVVTYADYLKPEQAQPVLQSTAELLAFVRKQDKNVRDHGVWIVTTHPDAYSESEKLLLEDIKTLCRKERIPLFIVRGSQLPNGWRRYDNAPNN